MFSLLFIADLYTFSLSYLYFKVGNLKDIYHFALNNDESTATHSDGNSWAGGVQQRRRSIQLVEFREDKLRTGALQREPSVRTIKLCSIFANKNRKYPRFFIIRLYYSDLGCIYILSMMHPCMYLMHTTTVVFGLELTCSEVSIPVCNIIE